MPSVPQTTRRRFGALITLAVLALPAGLAGCASADPEPTAPGDATSSSATSAAPSGPGGTAAPGTTGGSVPTPGSETLPSGPNSGRPAITLTKSGGIAGLQQSVAIRADGSWTFADAKRGRNETGKLTDAQIANVLKLATDPKVAQELRSQSKPGQCSDTFKYNLQVGESSISFEDCGQDRPATAALLKALAEGTPL